MNLYEKLNRLDDSKSLRESSEREYCIVAKTFDGKTKFYKDGAFIDDYKSCTTFNDLDDARSEWFDVDKSKYKRVFVPVYDPEAFAKVVTECNESVDDMDRRCEKCNTLLNDRGTCPKCDDGDMNEALDPEDVERNRGYRQDDLKDTFDIGDRVAHRWADEYNVGTIKDKRENEGIQYEVEWDYSEGDKVEWLYGDEITHWVDVASIKEELSNREKLKRAYPELNLNEGLDRRDLFEISRMLADRFEDSTLNSEDAKALLDLCGGECKSLRYGDIFTIVMDTLTDDRVFTSAEKDELQRLLIKATAEKDPATDKLAVDSVANVTDNSNFDDFTELSDEVQEIIYNAVQDEFEIGHPDLDSWKYVEEELSGLTYDKELAKKYFVQCIEGGSDIPYDDYDERHDAGEFDDDIDDIDW